MNLSHNLTLKRTLLSSSGKSNVQKAKSIFWTTLYLGKDIGSKGLYLGKDIGSKGLDIADKGLNALSQWIANVHDQANTPNPTNPELVELEKQLDNLSPELKEKVEKGIRDAISQIMESDVRERTNDKSDSV